MSRLNLIRALRADRKALLAQIAQLPPCACNTCQSGFMVCDSDGRLTLLRVSDTLDDALIRARGRVAEDLLRQARGVLSVGASLEFTAEIDEFLKGDDNGSEGGGSGDGGADPGDAGVAGEDPGG